MKENTSLTEIFMEECIGDEGAKAIGEALKVNTSLTSIDLNYNNIGNEGKGNRRGIESEYLVDFN